MASDFKADASHEPASGWQLPLDFRPRLVQTFDSLIVGRNAEPVTALRALLGPAAATQGPGPRMQLYLWGEPASGRSHVLAALAAAGAWWWLPDEEPARPGVALVDDVDALDAEAQGALFTRLHTVISRIRTLGSSWATAAPRCVVCGPCPPGQLALREDVRSRLAQGLVYRLHALNDAEMSAALNHRARARGATVADDLVPWMLTHLPRDIGRLSGVVDALDAYALMRRRSMTVPLLREWLGTIAGTRAGG